MVFQGEMPKKKEFIMRKLLSKISLILLVCSSLVQVTQSTTVNCGTGGKVIVDGRCECIRGLVDIGNGICKRPA